ncbi:alpha/beta hydrolase fold domain-containing protein [Microbacterium invictum]|uniref:Alpha/beta hydrolase fold domain-containing protein n=1 Tax=Microbacterium invictum TaxID=515415 RepID=A0ABZ0V9Y8_9MICO|nr:alpha/beta hydrolase fold domain-containing protein [Microbacterium invictum]WQB70274.1 alpha/beta hydrolase fold domain-containing protein [Microbacterium invictum]
MPLDPIFAERLRVHRRYLIGRAFTAAKKRLTSLWPFAHALSAGSQTPKQNAAARPSRRPATPDRAPAGPRARARAKHRRAALAWDRTELETVGTPGPDIRTTEHTVDVPGRPSARIRVYDPRPAADPADRLPLPAVLAFFGGAFRIGGIDYPTTDAGFRRRAADAGVVIAAVDYALAPEHRFPVAVEQGAAALRWLFAHAAELNVDADRIGILGTSAGANLAAAVALINRDDPDPLPLRLQVLEVPVLDLTGRHLDLRATRALGVPTVIALRELRSVARTYLPHRRAAREPLASPLRAASLEGLPSAVILTAEFDPLRGDGAAYAAALRAAGVDASAVQYLGVTHDTPIFTGVLPAARRWHADVVAALCGLHGGRLHGGRLPDD